LFGVFCQYRKITLYVIHVFYRVILRFKVKINSILSPFNFQHFWCKFLLEKILFQSQKCFFMRSHLSHLYNCVPIMRSKVFFTVVALSINLNELNNFGLFHLNFVTNIFSDVYFKFEPFGVRLCPNKFSIYEMCFI